MTPTKPVLKSFGKLNSPESKTTDSNQNVAVGALSGGAAPYSVINRNGEKVIARQCWAWTDRNGYDWMNEHWPFTDKD
jgi:hypothetical protein